MTTIKYNCLVIGSLLYRIAADGDEAQEGGGLRAEEPTGDDGTEPPAPSTTQTIITYGIGFVFGLIVGLWMLFYLCRKGSSDGEKIDKPNANNSSSTKYSKLATQDLERGGGLEMISSRSSSRNSISSGDEEPDTKNWDDWDEKEDGSKGEFVQSSSYINGASSPPRQVPLRESPVAASITSVPNIRPNSTIGSLGSTGSLGKLSAKSASPAPVKKRIGSKESRQRSAAPVGDDLFASIGISAAPTFKEAAPSPLGNECGGAAAYAPQKRVSDVMADADGGTSAWQNDDDDDLDI